RLVISARSAILTIETRTIPALALLCVWFATTHGARANQAVSVPRFEPAPCAKIQGVEWLVHASCGYLVVPEDRSNPNAPTIRLMVAKYSAQSAQKHPDPILYLEGGPGDIAPLEIEGLIKANFIHDRDIWVVSQRGTWSSQPALICAANNDFARKLLGLRFYSEETKRAHLAASQACRRELTSLSGDLAAYNSSESVADLADLRKVLGISKWNVYGNSFGTYTAQTLMREYPEGIRSVVLDSVLPVSYSIPVNWSNTRYGFESIFRACAAQPACNAAYPYLERTFTRLVNKLEAEPLTPVIRDPNTGKNMTVVLDGGALVDWLRNQTYTIPSLQAAPDTIVGLAAGRRASIEAIAKDRAGRAPPYHPGAVALGDGLAVGTTCREDYLGTPQELAAAGREAFPDYPASITREGIGGWAYVQEDCRDVWKFALAPKSMHEPVASNIPTLLISGTFDTLTSLAGAKAAAARLSRATIISIPGVGHTVSPWSPCAQKIIVAFYADPNGAPDTSCVGTLKPSKFTSKRAR
ncbi:MAG TPA: alpha/beta fold hydrolase, partial [Candidatus Nitrosotalea sp.]|nr:alpha/beta fold hydrolase [Candidatus Nitrosotalea sp.]